VTGPYCPATEVLPDCHCVSRCGLLFAALLVFFLLLDLLASLRLFLLAGPKTPFEETYRPDPYNGRAISCDDVAWVMHSQINARKSNHSH
jgi:hypothetical protein